MDNWRSSSDRSELTDDLVQAEINQGWVEPFDGTIEDAQTRWPTGVAIGRLGIAISDSRDPRLVVDSSICGTNSSCSVREHQALPTSKDVLRTFPFRDNDDELGGMSLDIRQPINGWSFVNQNEAYLVFHMQVAFIFIG